MKSDIVFFARKEVYRDSKGYVGIPSWFCCALYSLFSFNAPLTGGKSTVYLFGSYEKRHRIFFQKEVYCDSIGIPLLVLLCPQQLIFVQCTVNWRKIHRYTVVWNFIMTDKFGVLLGHPRQT